MKYIYSDIFFSIAVLFQIITSIVQLILPLTGVMSVEQAAIIRVVVTLVTFAPAIMCLLFQHVKGLVLSFSLFIFVLAFNYAFFPASEVYITSSQAWTLTPISILTVLCMYNIKGYERFWKLLLYSARFCAILAVLYFLLFTLSPFRESSKAYNMHFGYSLLLPIMYLFTRPGFVDRILSFLMLGIVLLIGSRGPAGMALFFYFVYILFVNRLLLIKISIALLFLIPIALANLPDTVDIESARTIALILNGEVVSHDSDRSDIYKIVERKISERPLTGWGIGSDRAILDTYAHNFALELALHYGVLMSMLIIMVVLFLLIRGFSPKRFQRIGGWVFIVMMSLYGFIPLMFTNSYLIDYKFATFIGVLLSSYRKRYHEDVVCKN